MSFRPMTLTQARKILGKTAKDVSDEELQDNIDTAELLKEIFFSLKTSKKE
jgi:hypothetical protein